MKKLDLIKLKKEIALFEKTLAPSPEQQNYIRTTKHAISNTISAESVEKSVSIERVFLVAVCGDMTQSASEREQAEFATRLLLMSMFMESLGE